MNLKIKEWSQSEAEEWFNRIEKSHGKGEGYNIDWKEKWNFAHTGFSPEETNNTTQRAVSGFANTYGGVIVFGFDKKGTLIEVEEKKDVENYFQTNLEKKISPHPSLFITKYYSFKGKQILVVFVEKSQIPLQCDNGVYYYREQSEFRFMPHHLLETKFRRIFDDEKYLFLVSSELKQLIEYAEEMKLKLLSGGTTVSYRISIFCNDLLKSGDYLYQFYRENNLIRDYNELSKTIKFWCVDEMDSPKEFIQFKTLKEDVEKFYKKLEEARANEKAI